MEAGKQITPTLRLVRQLGQGGMGSVWIADHLALGTQVAVKFMAPAFAQHPSLVQRFQREAVAAAQIKSPHVAQVFDHGVTPTGEPYIVMELLDGEDLGKRVRRAGPLTVAEIAAVVSQVAKALHRAHQLGIVHRDIKPDNIFIVNIDGEQLVKVLDFGIAKHATESLPGMTSTGSVLGTPLYMSPEQLLSSKGVDFRSDLWSLGIVTYFALTGRVPFHGETIGSISVAVHTGVFSPPSTVRGGLPRSIDAWVAHALTRDPAGRFASAREMADALERVAREPSTTSPDGVVASPAPWPIPTTPLPLTPQPTPSPIGPGAGPAAPTMSDALTLLGTANTRGGASAKRLPVIAALFVLLVAAGAIGVFLLRRSAPSAAVPAASATADITVVATAEPPLTATDTAPLSIVTAAATAIASSRATAGPPASVARRPTAPSSTATAAPLVKPGKPAPGKDTIGF